MSAFKDIQIEELAETINNMSERNAHYYDKHLQEHEAFADAETIAKTLYRAGYRKLIESKLAQIPVDGKWRTRCGNLNCARLLPNSCDFSYCPYCGAHITGGENQ